MSNSARVTEIDDILEEMATACHKWAEAKAEVERLENKKKAILAVEKTGNGTNAAKEDAAYSSQAYASFLEQHFMAVKEEAYLRARRDYLTIEFERWRTDRADARTTGRV